ncbi:MAG: hypothetical protein IJL37_02675 [Bacteroidaceae bacterium]|nr:hypothetical protein [Bacteroidaceae bacterium]
MDITIQNSEISVVDSYWEKLRTLSKTARLYLANKLTDSVKEEEAIDHTKRIAKVKRHRNVPTDEELKERFANKPMPPIPEEEPSWKAVIDSNTGKTIKSIEKWL